VNELQAVVVESWRREKPLVETHVGDLAWWSREPDSRHRVWHDGGDPVAWGWAAGGHLSLHVRADRRGLGWELDVLRWFDGTSAWCFDRDDAKAAALDAAGFAAVPGAGFHHLVRDLTDLPSPAVPDGYRLMHVTDTDVGRRVAVGRAAFTGSTMTDEKYLRLRSTWPYREKLDAVIEGPDGSLAAFCLAWLDAANGAGELEPVGTHPDHRRLGLASAASLEALRRLRALGADTCVVYAADRPAYPASLALYTSLGFESRARHVRYER
jgi:ribosomal protein S18 acetylase RimI-like enzyme